MPELKELLANLDLIAPEAGTYTLAEVHAAVEGFHYKASSNFATLQADILATIEALIVENSPVIDGGDTAAFSVDENTTDVATIAASDAQGDALTYTLSGADAFLFQIDRFGALSFRDAPDFEAPGDVGGDNVYDVTVTVSDGAQIDSQGISVTVADMGEATPGLTLVFEDLYSLGITNAVSGSAGDDTISFSFGVAAISGNLSVDGGAGGDTISFGDDAAYGYSHVSADGGADSDTISFGANAGAFGHVSADGGGGSDTISFGADAGGNGGNVSVDLGLGDGAADELIFTGTVYNTSIQNWVAGEDALVDVVDPLIFTGVDNGTDTVFTDGSAYGQSLTFVGVTGLGTDVDDFLF